MGIKRSALKPRLAEVGKIKIGGKGEERKKAEGTGTYQLPTRYNHFVVTTTERNDKTGNFIPDFSLMEKIDPKEGWKKDQTMPEPKEIKIALLFDDIDLNFQTSFAYYQGARCLCRGDGEQANMTFTKSGKPTVFKMIDKGPDTVKEGDTRLIICDPTTCPNMQPDAKGQTRCKPSGILTCIIPASMNLGGVYRFRTHSWNTVSNILASLEFIKSITGGLLMGLPMKLQFLKKATQEHGNVSVVNIVFDGETHQQLRQQAMIEHKNRTDFNINMKLIETEAMKSGILQDLDDPKDVEEEFYSIAEEQEVPADIGDRASMILGVSDDPGDDEPEQEEEPAAPEPVKAQSKKQEKTVEPEPVEDDTTQLDIF